MNRNQQTTVDVGNKGPLEFSTLIPLVYGDLRRMAAEFVRHERLNHTLQPTALVHEAVLRLMKTGNGSVKNRAYFFGAAARAMRRILVEHSRARQCQKRGGRLQSVPLDEAGLVENGMPDYLAIDAILRRLENVDPCISQIVEYRVFGGFCWDEIAKLMNIPKGTLRKKWASAKRQFDRELRRELQ